MLPGAPYSILSFAVSKPSCLGWDSLCKAPKSPTRLPPLKAGTGQVQLSQPCRRNTVAQGVKLSARKDPDPSRKHVLLWLWQQIGSSQELLPAGTSGAGRGGPPLLIREAHPQAETQAFKWLLPRRQREPETLHGGIFKESFF